MSYSGSGAPKRKWKMRITAGREILDEGDPPEESVGGDGGDGDGAGPCGLGTREKAAWYAAALAVALGVAAVAAVVEVLAFGRLDLARVALVEGLVAGLVVAR